MTILALANGVANTVAAQTGVLCSDTPFIPGRVVEAVITLTGASGTPVVNIEGSDDDVTYAILLTSSVLGTKVGNVTLQKYMRHNVTTTGTAGTGTSYLSAGA